MRGTRAGAIDNAANPWRQLAAGILHRALLDAGGRELRDYDAADRRALQAQAQRWLLSDAAAGLMAILDLHHEAVLDVLTSPTPARRPQRGGRSYDHEQSQ